MAAAVVADSFPLLGSLAGCGGATKFINVSMQTKGELEYELWNRLSIGAIKPRAALFDNVQGGTIGGKDDDAEIF